VAAIAAVVCHDRKQTPVNGTRIGIVGAYGATGAVVARTFAAQRSRPLLLIGRNTQKLDELAGSITGDVATASIDVMDERALVDACRDCQVVINCAGPASVILDRVGHAALEAGAHYVDPGPDERVFQNLRARDSEIRAKGLVFLLGAGYVPGLSELLLRAAYEVHQGRTNSAYRVHLVVADHNDWSVNGFVDILERACRHPPQVGVYEAGTFRSKSMLTAWVRTRLPGHQHPELLIPIRWQEIESYVAARKPARAAVYIPMEPMIYFIGRLFARIAPHRIDLAARIAQALFRHKAKRTGSGGILFAEAAGREGHAPLRWVIDVPEGRHYERTGQVAALAADLISDGTIGAHGVHGVHYLAHAVDPHDFIIRLLPWGVETIDLAAGSADAVRYAVDRTHIS
jgi:short subunit dehydrogenase-like uncharacterized protein